MMLNKKFSKVLCAILAFAMIVTMLPAMALVASAEETTETAGINKLVFSDIAGSPYQREIGVLNAISILAGDPEGTFRPGDSISRAEMAAIIVRIYGMEASVVPGPTKFDDVPADHWSSGYVNIASGLGVINGDGDGKFRPDDKVKYNEAVKMLVCVLGYGLHAQEAGGWPAGYLVQATSLGIDEDVINQGGEASRETVAKLVYNTIDLEYLEKVGYGTEEQWVSVEGRTLLSEKMKIQKVEDIVSETFIASVFGESSLKEGQVRIGNTRYLVGETDISEYIGYPVVAYAKFDAKVNQELSTLSYYEIMEEDVVYVEAIADDLADVSANSITLYEDYENSAKTVKYTKNADTYIFQNGLGNMNFDLNGLLDGDKVKFNKLAIIDIDDDKIMDALFVEETHTIVVNNAKPRSTGFYINGIHKTETFPEESNSFIDISDDADKVNIVKDGEIISYKELKKYDVVTYSFSGNVYNFTVCNETVEGKIEQKTSEGEYVIDGKAYELSTYFEDYKVEDHPKGIDVGDEVVAYLDVYGQIAHIDVKESSSADSYGYVLGTEYKTVFGEEQYSLVVLTSDNEKVKLAIPTNEKVQLKSSKYEFDVVGDKINSVDFKLVTSEELIDGVTPDNLATFGILKKEKSEGGDTVYRPIKQMIKYAASDGKITQIETALEILPLKNEDNKVKLNTSSGVKEVTLDVSSKDNAVKELATANKAMFDKINAKLYNTTPKKYEDEEKLFTKTVIMDAYKEKNGSATTKVSKGGNGYFAVGDNPADNHSSYKWKDSKVLFIPTSEGSAITSDIQFISSDEFMAPFPSYGGTQNCDFVLYDCQRDGTAAAMIVEVEVKEPVTSEIVNNTLRSNHMIITKIGTGTDADGDAVTRVVGLGGIYNNNKTSEITLTLDEETSVLDRDGAADKITLEDLSVGDVIRYTTVGNGKVYAIKSLFSVEKDLSDQLVTTGSFKDFVSATVHYNTVLLGYIVASNEEDDETTIRLTEKPGGVVIDLDDDTDTLLTEEYDPTTFTNYWKYDTVNKTLKKVEFSDIPMPVEISEDEYLEDTSVGYKVKYKDDGVEYTNYVKAPKVLLHVHKSDSKWTNINFIYFDDGSLDF